MIDLTLIPDEDLKREYMRRLNATRRRAGGRPVQMKPCPNCGSRFPATALRLVHLPQCRRNIDPRAIRAAINAANKHRGGPGVYAADSVGRGAGQWVRIDDVKVQRGETCAHDVNSDEWFLVDRWEVR
jgi:hypothetical protein